MEDKRLRVLAITHNFPRWDNDLPGNFILRLYGELKDKLEVRVVAPAFPGANSIAEIDGITVHRFTYGPENMQKIAYEGNMINKVLGNPVYSMMMLVFLYRMLELTYSVAREFRPHLIHAHWIFPGGIIAGLISKNLRIPLMLSIHGTDLRLARKNPFLRMLTVWLLKRSNTVVTVSRFLAREVENLLQYDIDVETIPMPVEQENFFPPEKRVLHEKTKIITVARLTKQKQIDVLLHASEILLKRGIEHTIQIVGDGTERNNLERLRNVSGLPVEFLGFQPIDRVGEYLREANIFVLPAVEEGFGLAVVEAMLSGLPVVLARSGAFTELVEDGRTGFLFQPSNAEELADILSKLIKNPELLQTISKNALKEARKRFSKDVIVNRYLRVVQSTIGINQ